MENGAAPPEQTRRFYALEDAHKARLLDPAEREFEQKGFERASMNAILAKAKMSKGQAYYYIVDKSDLYAHVCERAFGPLVRTLEPDVHRLKTTDAYWAWVYEALGRVSVYFTEHPNHAVLGRTVYESAAATAALSRLIDRLREPFNNFLAHGQSLGAVRGDLPFDLLASILFSILRDIDRWFALNLDRYKPEELAEIEQSSIAMLEAVARGAVPSS